MVYWYYLDPASRCDGDGWVQVRSTWYYLSPDSGAVMATGWLKEGGYWYCSPAVAGSLVAESLITWYHFADND